MLKLILSISIGKFIFFLTRSLNLGGGFAAPGYYALKIYPDLVSRLASQIPNQIIITGTNGKTTTSSMLFHLFRASNQKIIRNKTGSNLERGIASTLISHASIFGKISEETAIWEIDEAAFNALAPKLKTNLIVFLNVYRDQLDRYGEVDSIVRAWRETLKKLPSKTEILINADDGSLEELGKDFSGKVEYFSVKGNLIRGERETQNKWVKPRFVGLNIHSKLLDSISFTFQLDNSKMPVTLSLPGEYNIYNATAALSSKYLLGDLTEADALSLKDFAPPFGRFEQFEIRGKKGYIFLIKNPVGATQVLETVLPEVGPDDGLFMALSDNYADGTDVSWIWDIEIERFIVHRSSFIITVSGTRAYDLALRLKYAGVEDARIQVVPDIEQAFEKVIKDTQGKIFVLPTYTALLSLQKIMVKKGIKKHYWVEESK